jgi:hypothetical protein
MTTTVVDLPGAWVAVAGGGGTVWCATGDRLLAFDETGALRIEVSAPGAVHQLAATSDLLVAVRDAGVLSWLDPGTGQEVASRPVGSALELVSGGGAIWAIDRLGSRARRVEATGTLGAAHAVAGIDRAAADGDRFWWTSTGDARLRDLERVVDSDIPTDRGGIAACAGSIWVSVRGGLVRVGTWAAQAGSLVAAPAGPVPFLACAGGVLVGAAERHTVFVLDPSADADARAVEVDTGGAIGAMATAGRTVWLFPAGRAEAHVVPL